MKPKWKHAQSSFSSSKGYSFKSIFITKPGEKRKVYVGTQDSVLYERLIQLLKTYGRVLTEPVFITKSWEKG